MGNICHANVGTEFGFLSTRIELKMCRESPGTNWLAQPTELASSTFRERSCLSKYGEDLSRKYFMSDFGLHIHVGRHACTPPYMYIHMHVQSPHSQNKYFYEELEQ